MGKLDITKITNVSKLFGALWLGADDPATPKWDGIIPTTLWWVKPRRWGQTSCCPPQTWWC
jgi:hypothetical protein